MKRSVTNFGGGQTDVSSGVKLLRSCLLPQAIQGASKNNDFN